MGRPESPLLLISQPVAAMHREPDPLTEQVSQALLATGVQPLESAGEWQRIRTPDGYEGWLGPAATLAAPAGWHAPWAEIADLWVNLRARPDYRLASALQAPIGTRLPLLARRGDWIELLVPDGRRLWTESKRVAEVGETPLRPAVPVAVCRTALRFLGIPYLWGGLSPMGLDCSGFTQTVMRLHGIALLRDAYQQATQGTAVTTRTAGDLVLFATGRDPERISHVGMMLSSRRFIHAAGSDRVRTNLLSDDPYPRQLLFARRVLPAA